MNKYEKALYELKMVLIYNSHKYGDSRLIDLNLETINELVEKATPKLPKRNLGKGTYYKCPVCESSIGTKTKYCKHCGQSIKWEKIDWSERMMNKLTKEECLEALEYICFNCDTEDCCTKWCKSYERLRKLIDEHFDNPPLKFEELEENNWYWDNKDKEWCKYISYQTFEYLDGYGSEFEENRFYRFQCKGDDKID